MVTKYYLDTCIWIDYFENRVDNFRPLGDWALDLLKKIIKDNDLIIYSDLAEEELLSFYNKNKIEDLMFFVPKKLLIKINSDKLQLKEAITTGRKLKIPVKDVLHAILARDNNAIFVSRDKHFYELANQLTIKKPEELI